MFLINMYIYIHMCTQYLQCIYIIYTVLVYTHTCIYMCIYIYIWYRLYTHIIYIYTHIYIMSNVNTNGDAYPHWSSQHRLESHVLTMPRLHAGHMPVPRSQSPPAATRRGLGWEHGTNQKMPNVQSVASTSSKSMIVLLVCLCSISTSHHVTVSPPDLSILTSRPTYAANGPRCPTVHPEFFAVAHSFPDGLAVGPAVLQEMSPRNFPKEFPGWMDWYWLICGESTGNHMVLACFTVNLKGFL